MKHFDLVYVYYVESDIKGPTCLVAELHKSWDGSFYVETNLKELAGPKRVIEFNDVIIIDGVRTHGGPAFEQRRLLRELGLLK